MRALPHFNGTGLNAFTWDEPQQSEKSALSEIWVPMLPTSRSHGELGSSYPSSRAAYLLQKADALMDLVDAISAEDPMAEQRATVRAYSLGDYPQGALEEFKNRLADVMEPRAEN